MTSQSRLYSLIGLVSTSIILKFEKSNVNNGFYFDLPVVAATLYDRQLYSFRIHHILYRRFFRHLLADSMLIAADVHEITK